MIPLNDFQVRTIKLGLATLFLLCLLDMPYGFFQLVRFLALVGFGFLAFHANQKQRQSEAIIFIVLGILFQPLFKISLGRTVWNIVDVMVAIGLLISSFNKTGNENKKVE
jgi:hypothetical protein